MKHPPPRALWIAVFLVLLAVGFVDLGKPTIREWDEARHGQIALEMIARGDYLRYTFAGEPEQWFSKPPLAIWAIVGSYRLFGFNEFALRFPSALAAVLTVLVCVGIARLYTSDEGRGFPIWVMIILITSRGLFGEHVGRTGDTDAILVCMQVAFAYFLLRYVDFSRRPSDALFASLFLGLAFFDKSIASLPIAAGALLYVAYRRCLRWTVRRPETAIGALVFLSFIAAWYWISNLHGYRFSGSRIPGGSNWETMIRYDAFDRFFHGIEGHGERWSPFYLFKVLDILWSPWIYLFYILGIVALARRREPREPIVEAAPLLIAPLLLVVVSMRSRLSWYAAPLIPFLSLVLATWIERAWREYRLFRPFVICVAMVALTHEGLMILRPKEDDAGMLVRSHRAALARATEIAVLGDLRQDHRLALSWSGRKVVTLPASTRFDSLRAGTIVFSPGWTRGDGRARLFRIGEDGVAWMIATTE